ncbi:mRNA export factor TAP/MEX67 [Phaffia rhodozyma]|uniref:mRNA export factor TAP/MEX67 n=1 Tax=Phaffia rhodozyma TaxID=264483 RepID=A0A0F7SX72_PHARH|nr:mRNA export factor TAP/MEX67 [Phaffia rhodozyma]
MSIAEARMEMTSGSGPGPGSGSGSGSGTRPSGRGKGGRRGAVSGRNHAPGSLPNKPSDTTMADPGGHSIRGSSGSHKDKAHGRSDGGGRAGSGSGAGKGGKGSNRANPLAGAKPRVGAVEILRTWMAGRWNAGAAMLDLSKMSTDSYLLERSVFPPGHKGTKSAMAKVIWKLAAELKPPVVTVSYENNGLNSLESLEYMGQFLPSVRNLSISKNPLRDLQAVKSILSLKSGLDNLRELVTVDTPFRDKEITARGEEGYRTLMTSHFPFLRMLDSEPIFSITFDLTADEVPVAPSLPPSSTTASNSQDAVSRPVPSFPLDINQNFILGDADFVNAFLAKFFPLFDNSRISLAPVYLPTSTFSLTISTNVPHRVRYGTVNDHLPNQKSLTWKAYTAHSRNLMRMSKLADRITRLHVGGDDILKAFVGDKSKNGKDVVEGVPFTKHPIDQADKWSVDSFPIEREGATPLLMVNVHGEFEEMPSMGMRSFDRSFILSPSPPNSPAQAAGWPCVILSDMLTVRLYSGSKMFSGGSLPVQPGTTLVAVPLGVGPVAGSAPPTVLTDAEKEIRVSQFAEKSGLTIPFTVQCLDGNGWDLDRAWINFMELKDQIPPEAFTRPV